MKQIVKKLSLWNTLLAIASIIIMYLVTIHTNEALSYSSLATYFNENQALISWEPSTGPVENYLLEITETQFLSGVAHKNALMSTRQISTVSPFYKIICKHNHSYQVRVKATSATGISSSFSEPSILFISDQQKPEIRLAPLPSPAKVRSETLLISGLYEEPHLSSITVNGIMASINPVMNTFHSTIKLQRGVNLLTIHAKDLAGNTTTETLDITYAPLTIYSFPTGAKIYWNGNYAYPGIFSGTTPQSYNQALEGKSFLRITAAGFQDYCGIIDFSDLSKDSYTIVLSPFSPLKYNEMAPLFNSTDTAASSTHAHPFVVDYNLDGIKDLLVGTVDGNIMCYTGRESESTPQFPVHHFLRSQGKDIIDVGTHAAPFMVDYNNDGNTDLLVGNGSGSILYYVNQGSSEDPLFGSPYVLEDAYGIPLSVESHSKPFLVDWDGDKKKDILLGSGSGTIYYYRNQGTDQSPLFSSPQLITTEERPLAVGSHASPFVADWDGDGAKDLLVGDGEGYIHLYRNSTTSGEPHLFKDRMVILDNQELMVEGFSSAFLIDWNQDGANELLVGSSSGSIYYLN
jgi:hypothetical protein